MVPVDAITNLTLSGKRSLTLRMSRWMAVAGLALSASLQCIAPAPGQSAQGSRAGAPAIQTPSLGMTGYRDELTDLSTPKLGMTGYRDELTDLATPKLGMTGYRDELTDLTTPKLGMTGYRHKLIDLATPKLGMTGWRGRRMTAFPPAEPKAPLRKAAIPRGVKPQPKLTCIGGRVKGARCACSAGFKMVRVKANAFRCVRAVTLPKLKFNLNPRPSFRAAPPSRRSTPRRERARSRAWSR